MRRLWAIETSPLERELGNQHSADQVQRIATVFASLANNSQHLDVIHRYETRLHNIYQRAFHNLFLLDTASV
jgi:hypothetical protein